MSGTAVAAPPPPQPNVGCARCAELRAAGPNDLLLIWDSRGFWPGDVEDIRAMALALHAEAGHPEDMRFVR